jgi:hypothetical protein
LSVVVLAFPKIQRIVGKRVGMLNLVLFWAASAVMVYLLAAAEMTYCVWNPGKNATDFT